MTTTKESLRSNHVQELVIFADSSRKRLRKLKLKKIMLRSIRVGIPNRRKSALTALQKKRKDHKKPCYDIFIRIDARTKNYFVISSLAIPGSPVSFVFQQFLYCTFHFHLMPISSKCIIGAPASSRTKNTRVYRTSSRTATLRLFFLSHSLIDNSTHGDPIDRRAHAKKKILSFYSHFIPPIILFRSNPKPIFFCTSPPI